MELIISTGGTVRCLYDEAMELGELGPLQITRASHVEPDVHGQWWADMAPVHGPKLGPFSKRSEALDAELCWIGEADCLPKDNSAPTEADRTPWMVG